VDADLAVVAEGILAGDGPESRSAKADPSETTTRKKGHAGNRTGRAYTVSASGNSSAPA
jgi:hypothetical protein